MTWLPNPNNEPGSFLHSSLRYFTRTVAGIIHLFSAGPGGTQEVLNMQDFLDSTAMGAPPASFVAAVAALIPALKIASFVDKKASGSAGGGLNAGTFAAGTAADRALNTVLVNTIAGASLDAGTGRYTLPVGSFLHFLSADAYSVDRHQIALYNWTAGAVEEYGSNSYNSSGGFASSPSVLFGWVTTHAAPTDFGIKHAVQTSNVNGGGFAGTFDAGSPERYARAMVIQIS